MSTAPTIVVIEDTTEIMELMEVVLSDEGYHVVPCLDGRLALDIVIKEQPVLVIADLGMVGIGQWELVDALMTDSQTAHVPIIVCSGAVSELREAEARLLALSLIHI